MHTALIHGIPRSSAHEVRKSVTKALNVLQSNIWMQDLHFLPEWQFMRVTYMSSSSSSFACRQKIPGHEKNVIFKIMSKLE